MHLTAATGAVAVTVGDRIRFTKRGKARSVMIGVIGQVACTDGNGDELRTVCVLLNTNGREVSLHSDADRRRPILIFSVRSPLLFGAALASQWKRKRRWLDGHFSPESSE